MILALAMVTRSNLQVYVYSLQAYYSYIKGLFLLTEVGEGLPIHAVVLK